MTQSIGGTPRAQAAALAKALEAIAASAKDDLWPRSDELLAVVPIALAALDRIARAWSGSNIGPHALMYYGELEPPPAGHHWDADWGFLSKQTGWRQRTDDEFEAVVSLAIGRPIGDVLARGCDLDMRVDEWKHRAILVMDQAAEAVAGSDALKQRQRDLLELAPPLTVGSFLKGWMPGAIISRDMQSFSRGLVVAPHQQLRAEVLRAESITKRGSGLIRLIERAAAVARAIDVAGTPGDQDPEPEARPAMDDRDPRPPRGELRGQRRSLPSNDPGDPSVAERLAKAVAPGPVPSDTRESVGMLSQAAPPQADVPRPELAGAVTPPATTAVPDAITDRYRLAEETGRAAIRGWIGHPAVGRAVMVAKPVLERLVESLDLHDQLTVTLVTARFLDAAGRYPDGTTWPNPFAGAAPETVEFGRRVGPSFIGALEELAQRLAEAGVKLDPGDPGVLLVLAQLALLDIDLLALSAAIVDGLNVLPPGWVDREAAERAHVTIGASRHGRSSRFRQSLDAIGEDLARRLSPLGPISAPYAGGARRRAPRATTQLQRALAALVAKDPSLTPPQLLAIVADQEHSALVELREALGWQPSRMPDLRTLERNWPK